MLFFPSKNIFIFPLGIAFPELIFFMENRIRISIVLFLFAVLYLEGIPLPFLVPFALLLFLFIFLRDKVWKRAEKEVEFRLPFSKSWHSWALWLLVFFVFFLLYSS